MARVYVKHCAAIYSAIHATEDAERILRAEEPDYKQIITNATLRRRMNRMLKMGVTVGLEVLEMSGSVDQLIVASGLGSISDTERFLDNIYSTEETLLNPTPFIQSTFNTLAGSISQLASLHVPTTTFINRSLSFANALVEAKMQFDLGKASSIMVVAADEATEAEEKVETALDVLPPAARLGEGAAAFSLATDSRGAVCELIDVFDNAEQDEVLDRIGIDRKEVVMMAPHRTVAPKFDCVVPYEEICGKFMTSSAVAMYMACSDMLGKYTDYDYFLIKTSFVGDKEVLILLKRC